ncbi:hypothetical protein EXE30_02795 [Acinetobacter halotolerans]|uniref:Uncharacterized protein n=1 Tax=Acinetobacter halotolerans TaxID=1752076 RepID=A0A4Q6XCX4_9GAMM|nr:hypothetical protein [Acinetobacter halotolerans]RZF55754.1 hypothetical protein EXE30_02795 [Acinetobacter halotolerans]
MKNKLLTIFCGSTLLLTACGGGSDGSNNSDSFQSKEKVNYTKPEEVELIYETVFNLSKKTNNQLINPIAIANDIYTFVQQTTNDGYRVTCMNRQGTVTRKSDSVTLNKCQGLQYTANGVTHPAFRSSIVFTGVISAQHKQDHTEFGVIKRELNLNNLKLEISNQIFNYNGKAIIPLVWNEIPTQYDIPKMEFQWSNRDFKAQYVLNNYRFYQSGSDSVPMITSAEGNLVASIGGKWFSVNFESKLRFGNTENETDGYPYFAEIFIEDSSNLRNYIGINNTSDGKALIRAYTNGSSVQSFPKTLDWNELN